MGRHISAELKLQAVLAYKERGVKAIDISKLYNVHITQVYEWIRRYERGESLENRRAKTQGQQPAIKDSDVDKVKELLTRPASDFGWETCLWTISRMLVTLKKELGIKISSSALHRFLRKQNFTYKKPQIRFYEADDAAKEEWVNKTLPKIEKTAAKNNSIIFYLDEANVSLLPTAGKTWSPMGAPTTVKVTGNRGSVSIISAISGVGKLYFNLHDQNKRYRADDIITFLRNMMLEYPKRHLTIIMDRAPCHTAKKVKEFVADTPKLDVVYLPPRSPDLNPDEKVWAHLKHVELAGHQAKSTKELKRLARKKLNRIKKDPKKIKGIFMRSNIGKKTKT
jgi:transposase